MQLAGAACVGGTDEADHPMRIWHQSFTDLSALPRYRETLQAHARTVMPDAEVVVHGLMPGTYGKSAPMDVNSHQYLRMLNGRQVCEAAVVAERAGYDAFALGCFFDPALQEARSLVDIPVVGLAETCMLTACSLGRRFGLVSLNEFQRNLTEDLASQYGVAGRLAGVAAMAPPVRLIDLEVEAEAPAIRARFEASCRELAARGAEVIIPGDGVLNAFLVRHRVLQAEGMVVMDPLSVLFHHAAYFARLRAMTGLTVSRRGYYKRPSAAMLEVGETRVGQRAVREDDFSGRA
jgi:Asp/Glu/hydantoin racemase